MATEKTKKKFQLFHPPSRFCSFCCVVIALATWFVPAGSYDYDEEGAPDTRHLPPGGAKSTEAAIQRA